jgi:hypothetical protein
VSAVVWALFDHASQQKKRGDISTFDVETYAIFSGISDDVISRIIDALKAKNIIVNGKLKAWEDRQPSREDNSSERVKAFRNNKKNNETRNETSNDKKRSVTQCNGDETQCNAPEEIQSRGDSDTEVDSSETNLLNPTLSENSFRTSEKKINSSDKKTDNGYTEAFEKGFWEPYPRHKNMSKVDAFRAWKKLSHDERRRAIAAVPEFVKWLTKERKRKPDYDAPHAATWLNGKRFEGFAEEAVRANGEVKSKILIKEGTSQADAWIKFFSDKSIQMPNKVDGGWMMISEWPPNHRVENLTTQPVPEEAVHG